MAKDRAAARGMHNGRQSHLILGNLQKPPSYGTKLASRKNLNERKSSSGLPVVKDNTFLTGLSQN